MLLTQSVTHQSLSQTKLLLIFVLSGINTRESNIPVHSGRVICIYDWYQNLSYPTYLMTQSDAHSLARRQAVS